MTHLNDLIPPADLTQAIDAGHIARRTPATIRCRGLIADDATGEIVAWPFPKFFNVAEHDLGQPYAPPLPDEPFEVYDKIDGSLGVVFHHADRWHAASKGSFTSEQATWAQRWLDEHDTGALWPDTTYLAEIVYPENRIVVDYGQRQDLVLLGAFDRDGTEIPLATASVEWLEIGSVVRSWPAPSLMDLLKLTAANARPDGTQSSGTDAEGYVLRFASGLRAKAKLAEYVRLHKVITGITERDIWRYLGIRKFAEQPAKLVAKALGCSVTDLGGLGRGRDPLDALLEQVPDEFDAWVRGVAARLEEQAADAELLIESEYKRIETLGTDRRAFAGAAQLVEDRAVRAAMFLRLDGRPIDLHVWRSIKPEAADPFKNDEEG